MGGEYAYIYGVGTVKRLLPLVLLLTACANAGTPTLDPRVQVAAMNELDKINATATAMSQGVNNAAFNQSLTQAFVPPALTATALGQHATELANASGAEHATQVAFYNSAAVTFTQQALAVLESDTQRRVSENNRVIADGVRWGAFWHSVLEWGALVIIFAVSISATWGVIQFGLFAHTYRKEREKELKRRIDMRVYRDARDEAGSDFLLTSAGPMLAHHPVDTRAEERKRRYDHESAWRTACRKLIEQGVLMARSGVKHPFSETSLSPFVSRPETGAVWVDGYRKLVNVLKDAGALSTAGARSALGWGEGWNWETFDARWGTTPLPNLPEGNPPHVKIPIWSFAEAA